MFGLGQSKKRETEEEIKALSLLLLSTGCLFLSMHSRRLSGQQYCALISQIESSRADADRGKIAYKLTEQLAIMNEMDPHAIVLIFRKGVNLPLKWRGYIIYNCIIYVLLDRLTLDGQANDTKIPLGIVGDYARELNVKRRHVNHILDEALNDYLYVQPFGYQHDTAKPKCVIEKALNKTYRPSPGGEFEKQDAL